MTPEPVAIVGMAALLPGARTLREYWANIVGGIDCIADTPPSRWRPEDHFDPNPAAPDKTYCQRGGFVPDVDLDALEMGLPPNSLDHTDAAQLLALVVARDALADAGYDGQRARKLPSERTGVVLGVAGTTMKLYLPLAMRLESAGWERALIESGCSGEQAAAAVERIKASYLGWTEDAFPGFLTNVVAGRIASRLDLGGITCVVDAACASSLCSVRMAISELASGNCDVMIAGGVDTDNSIAAFVSFCKTPALSPRQEVRPFDAAADGTLISEGIGMVVLKRLADAVRDGDRVYAHILAVGASSDGRSKSIYAPRASGQVRALRAAYSAAGVRPASVELVEAHGTGTPAGDEAEIEALREVLESDGAALGSVALGSVKSQIGHAKAAAGIASLIKAAPALYEQVLPPTLGISQPHRALSGTDGGGSALQLNTALRPWLRSQPELPRRAGVSAFGFGGTNYHAVLEEPGVPAAQRRRMRGRVCASAGGWAAAVRCGGAQLRRADRPLGGGLPWRWRLCLARAGAWRGADAPAGSRAGRNARRGRRWGGRGRVVYRRHRRHRRHHRGKLEWAGTGRGRRSPPRAWRRRAGAIRTRMARATAAGGGSVPHPERRLRARPLARGARERRVGVAGVSRLRERDWDRVPVCFEGDARAAGGAAFQYRAVRRCGRAGLGRRLSRLPRGWAAERADAARPGDSRRPAAPYGVDRRRGRRRRPRASTGVGPVARRRAPTELSGSLRHIGAARANGARGSAPRARRGDRGRARRPRRNAVGSTECVRAGTTAGAAASVGVARSGPSRRPDRVGRSRPDRVGPGRSTICDRGRPHLRRRRRRASAGPAGRDGRGAP